MAVPITDEAQRKYPLNQPQGWEPKVARYTLQLPDDVKELSVANIGIQVRNGQTLSKDVIAKIDEWASSNPHKPLITEKFTVLFGRDQPDSLVYACYWTSDASAANALYDLKIREIFDSLPDNQKQNLGLWWESFNPDLTRFETNYAGTDYRPGIAQLTGSVQAPHNLTGYWGAARDRIHASAYEHLDDSDVSKTISSPPPPDFSKSTLSMHFRGISTQTLAHIRSGQFWENCPEDESTAYEEKLQPHLLNGLHDILDHPVEKGDYGLRFLRNVPTKPQSHTRKETCAISFFRSLHDLEDWAKNCPSHHKIYGGALSHKNRFGDGYKFRTWHEVSVMRPGEVCWEYVNCESGTGLLPFVESEFEGKLDI